MVSISDEGQRLVLLIVTIILVASFVKGNGNGNDNGNGNGNQEDENILSALLFTPDT